jgi:hypothetical protein
VRTAFLCLCFRFVLYWRKPTGAKTASRMLISIKSYFSTITFELFLSDFNVDFIQVVIRFQFVFEIFLECNTTFLLRQSVFVICRDIFLNLGPMQCFKYFLSLCYATKSSHSEIQKCSRRHITWQACI